MSLAGADVEVQMEDKEVSECCWHPILKTYSFLRL